MSLPPFAAAPGTPGSLIAAGAAASPTPGAALVGPTTGDPTDAGDGDGSFAELLASLGAPPTARTPATDERLPGPSDTPPSPNTALDALIAALVGAGEGPVDGAGLAEGAENAITTLPEAGLPASLTAPPVVAAASPLSVAAPATEPNAGASISAPSVVAPADAFVPALELVRPASTPTPPADAGAKSAGATYVGVTNAAASSAVPTPLPASTPPVPPVVEPVETTGPVSEPASGDDPTTQNDAAAAAVARDAAATSAVVASAGPAPPAGLQRTTGSDRPNGKATPGRRSAVPVSSSTNRATEAAAAPPIAPPPGLTESASNDGTKSAAVADRPVASPASPFASANAVPGERRGPETRAEPIALDRSTLPPTAATKGDAGVARPAISAAASASAEIVADAVGRAIEQNRPIRVRLDPPELGTVRVEVSAGSSEDPGAVRVRLTASDPGGRATLAEALPGLRDTLKAAGMTVESIDLDPAIRPERAEAGRESGRDADRRDSDSGNRRESSERESGGRSGGRSGGEADDDRGRGDRSADGTSATEGSGDSDSEAANGGVDSPAPVDADADWAAPASGRTPAGSLDVAA